MKFGIYCWNTIAERTQYVDQGRIGLIHSLLVAFDSSPKITQVF